MKKFYYIFLLIFIFFTSSCTNKEVQLPKIEIDGIPEIHNHSSIWIFYEKKGNEVSGVLNKNNKILNTHWIFNIDKRLPIKEVVPFLIEMQKNKNKDSMHKKEGMLNYFSYANIKSNQIALLNFTPTNYINNIDEYKNLFDSLSSTKIIELDIQNEYLLINDKSVELNQLQIKIEQLKLIDSVSNYKLVLKYDENTPYQNYLETKVFLSKIEIQIDSTEYIYSLK